MASQMVIAVEEHWGSAETERLRDDWLEASGLPGTKNHATRAENLKTLWDFDARIPIMDDAGISRQVISLSSPGVQGIRNPEQATATAHRLNRTQYELMKRFPDRFYGFANLPLCDPNGAADELEYCISHYGFVGALIHGHCYGKYLDDPCYNVLWEAAQAHNALLYMHITDPDPRHTLDLGRYPVLSGPCWSWGVEAATHALRLMVGGVFDRFPGARFAMGHMGEGLPYLLGRLEEGATIVTGNCCGGMKKRFIDYMRENIYISTSGGYFPETMRCAISAVGAERIFFAVDYPFAKASLAMERFQACNLPEEQAEQILFRNFLNVVNRLK